MCGLIGGGLEEQITDFLSDHPKTKLVIIDTLQKVRDTKGGADVQLGDFREIGKLGAVDDLKLGEKRAANLTDTLDTEKVMSDDSLVLSGDMAAIAATVSGLELLPAFQNIHTRRFKCFFFFL